MPEKEEKKGYFARRREATAARSDEENMARLKSAKYLAIWIIVLGVGYFIYKAVTKDSGGSSSGSNPGFSDDGYLTRNCFSYEVPCDDPCNGRAKNLAGKYCCRECTT